MEALQGESSLGDKQRTIDDTGEVKIFRPEDRFLIASFNPETSIHSCKSFPEAFSPIKVRVFLLDPYPYQVQNEDKGLHGNTLVVEIIIPLKFEIAWVKVHRNRGEEPFKATGKRH